MTMNSRWFRSSNHHLLSEARYRNGTRAVSARTRSGSGRQPERPELDAEQAPGDDHADRRDRDAGEDQDAVDAEELRRRARAAPPWRIASPSAKIGASHSAEPARAERQARGRCPGRPTGSPAGSAGWSSTGGDSWILSQTSFGPRNVAPERQAHQPEHVERGQAGDDEADRPDPQEAVLERLAEDLVLARRSRPAAGCRRSPASR